MPIRSHSSPIVVETIPIESRYYADNGCVASGSIIVDSAGSSVVSNSREEMEGWDTPGWRRMRNEGQILPFTPFWHYKYSSRHNGDGVYAMCWGSLGKLYFLSNSSYVGSGNWLGLGISVFDRHTLLALIPEPDPSYEVQAAAAAIASEGWDALTFIAEIKDLRRMLHGIFTKIEALTRGRKPFEIFKFWLELRYGWRTLMYDIQDFMKAIESLEDKRTRKEKRVGRQYSGVINRYGEDVSSPHTRFWSETISYHVSVRGSVVADIDVPKFKFNPLVTGWEVLHFSFIFDWLVNVGQALDAITFHLLASNYQSAGGYRIDFETAGNVGVKVAGPGHATFSGSYKGSGFYKKRFPAAVDPTPRVRLRLDPFKIFDLIALIKLRFS